MQLYYSPNAISQTTELLVRFLELENDIEKIAIDFASGEQRSDAYLAKTPWACPIARHRTGKFERDTGNSHLFGTTEPTRRSCASRSLGGSQNAIGNELFGVNHACCLGAWSPGCSLER